MRGFTAYLYVQSRRTLKLLPALLGATLTACVCIGVLWVMYMRDSGAQEQEKFRIAVVGDISGSYLGFGIFALQAVDDSRFMMELPTMTEEEARRALAVGELTAYVAVPEGLVDSIVTGTNDRPIRFVGAAGQQGIAGILIRELTDVATTLITRSQSAIYGMQRVLQNHGMGERWWEATETLNVRFIDMVLNRTGLAKLELSGMAGGLSTEGYYLCAMLVFFLLLAGIFNSPLFVRRSHELGRLMASKGVGAFCQVAGEYLACLLLNLCCLLGIFLALGLAMSGELLQIPEWKWMGAEALGGFFVRLLPVAAALSAMQFLLYELVTGVVNGILLQFVCGISMAYLAGCFYPASFFPDAARWLGEHLPAGLALRYADQGLAGGLPLLEGLGLIVYVGIFLGLAVLVRKHRLQRG